MPRKDLNKFFIGVVIPSILAIGLFIISIFSIILPSFERNIMDKKKEMISELTNTAWSLLEEYDQEFNSGNLTLEQAQDIAKTRIKKIRYGGEGKDYFWIIDKHPKMIMHPYRDELINSDLSNYKDPNGKKLFVEATKIVEESGNGFINYMWQWKDDSTRIVPKLSFVKVYEPWNWIIGTGIYLEDVNQEIKTLKSKLLRTSIFITIIIIIILLFVIRQSLIIENKRNRAEDELILSRQKYKSLVEASTEGTLMILNNEIIFSNLKFSNLIGYESQKVLTLRFEEIFNTEWDTLISTFDDPKKTVSLETQIICADQITKDVIISVSKINYANDNGYILITKEVSKQIIQEKETENLSHELQTSLLLMNQPIRCFVSDILKCPMNSTIHDVALLMTKKKRDVAFITNEDNIIGVVNDSDLKERVIAQNLDIQKPIIEIMTSPVSSISENALLYEAILLLRNRNISHLAVKNLENEYYASIGYRDISRMQENTLSYLIKEIDRAENVDQLEKIHSRLPVLVNALIESGDKTQNITRIITSVTDTITQRIVALAIEELGPPPCEFAFMVVGSEGRKEQTLSTDQDNAIVYQDLDNANKTNIYFNKLGQIICQNLYKVGYKLCDGGNMANNPKWTQPLSVWKKYFIEWVNTSDPQSILDASIFFDFRCVYGSEYLIDDLHIHVNSATDNKSVFYYHLAQSVIKYRPPVSLFGNIIGNNQTSDGKNLDIKKILLPIVSFIRLYAIYYDLKETNSLERIKQLYNKGIINKELYSELKLSYNYLMQIRFRFQSKSILKNEVPNNIVDINKLTHIEIATIKKIFNEINNLQTKTNFDFKGGV